MIIRTIAKLLALLNSNRRAVEVGAAIAFGLWLALVPADNLIFATLVLVLFLTKVNLGMAIASFLILSFVAPVFDPALDTLGFRILTLPSLQDFYRDAYALPIVPLTRFNDTVVAGSLAAGAALFVPVTAVAVVVVRFYRKHVHPRIVNSKTVKAFLATPFAQRVAVAFRQVQRVWPTTG